MSAALKFPNLGMDADFVLACLRRYREHLDVPQKVSRPNALDGVLIGDLMTGDDRVAFTLRDPIRTALRETVRDVAWRVFTDGGMVALTWLFDTVTGAAEFGKDWSEHTLGQWFKGIGDGGSGRW